MATMVEESRWMAAVDLLTGLMNRRAFIDWGKREAHRSLRYKDPLSMILLDVDHFKIINDQRGHAAGDRVLTSVARLLSLGVRSCDVVARWGGEEFVVALPSTPLAGAMIVADRMRQELEDHEIADASGNRIRVTASFGVAQFSPQESLEQLVDRADRAMYGAKSAGRNRIYASGSDSSRPVASAALAAGA
jgi:diguanylate cyclase (GGDEF)-like protein